MRPSTTDSKAPLGTHLHRAYLVPIPKNPLNDKIAFSYTTDPNGVAYIDC